MIKLLVLKGDITKLNVDIIVNAANNSLLGGGGVDGAIHTKAGSELKKECLKLNGCLDGEAKITNAYKLPSKKIIHTVGPVYKNGNFKEEETLKNCYLNSMKIAENYRIEKNLDFIWIAFPCISTGVFKFPKQKAAKIAINTIRTLNNNNIKTIFICYDDINYSIYIKELYNINI